MSSPSRISGKTGRSQQRSCGRLGYFGLTALGRERSENEDAWFADPQQGLFILSDGMGGACAGGLAATIVVEILPLLIRERLKKGDDFARTECKKQLKAALVELSVQVREKSHGQPGLEGMGATVVLALIKNHRALIAHMGDSRAYLFRKGSLEQLTKDHSLAQLLVESGAITLDEARAHPARHRLTRFVGMASEPLPVVRRVELHRGDRLLLCSDGLTGMVSDAELYAILKEESTPKGTCECLVATANKPGGRDNITALVVAF